MPSGLVAHGPSLAPANGTFLASETPPPSHCPVWSLLRSPSLGQGRLALVPAALDRSFPQRDLVGTRLTAITLNWPGQGRASPTLKPAIPLTSTRMTCGETSQRLTFPL